MKRSYKAHENKMPQGPVGRREKIGVYPKGKEWLLMRKKGKDIFSGYLGKNGLNLWLVLFFLVLGISIGAFTEKMMGTSQRSDLLNFVNTYFNVIHLDSLPKSQIFIKSLINNFKLLGIIFLSGSAVIGFPIAIGALTFRGITIGFAAAFFMEEMQMKGLLLAIFSILPQNIVLVPAYVIATAVSIGFSWNVLLKKGSVQNKGYMQFFWSYLSIFIVISGVFIIGCLIESYICPILIKMIVAI